MEARMCFEFNMGWRILVNFIPRLINILSSGVASWRTKCRRGGQNMTNTLNFEQQILCLAKWCVGKCLHCL